MGILCQLRSENILGLFKPFFSSTYYYDALFILLENNILFFLPITVGKSVVHHTLVMEIFAVVEADCSVLFNIITLSSLTSVTTYAAFFFSSLPYCLLHCSVCFFFKEKKCYAFTKCSLFKQCDCHTFLYLLSGCL